MRPLLAVAVLLSGLLSWHVASASLPVVWVFGHSIPAGVGTSTGGWPADYALLTGATVRNFAVGGAVLDPLGQPGSTVDEQVRGALAEYPAEVPALVLVDVGTNDLVSHDTNTLTSSKWAAIGADLQLQGRGVARRYWMTILPMGHGSAHPDAWLGTLTERADNWNTWLRAMGSQHAFGVADMVGVLHEDGGLITAPWLEPDGLHPGNDGALLIAAAAARATGSAR